MKLLSKKFKFTTDIYGEKPWWYSYDLELCHGTLLAFVDIPQNIYDIEITLSTNRLSKHSLVLVDSGTFESNYILVDGERVEFQIQVVCFLSEYFKKYKKLFVTVYYTA